MAQASGVPRVRFNGTPSWGRTAVKRAMRAFLKEGILVETGARTCKNGFTVVYRINLAKVEALDSTLEPEIETGGPLWPGYRGHHGPQTIL
ncbi:MAG: hypothetical protein ACI853_002159 [Paracoccaceae bacterium]|jgi:hypothetical protein